MSRSLDEGLGDAFEVADFDAHHALEIATHAQDAHLEMQAYGVRHFFDTVWELLKDCWDLLEPFGTF
jgi:hypothetical protein